MRLSLRYKAAVLIAVTETLLLGLLLFSNLHNTREELEQQLAAQAASTAELVATSATEPLLALDLSQLNSLLKGIVNKNNIKYVAIQDHRGSVLADAGTRVEPEHCVRREHAIYVADSLFGSVVLETTRDRAVAALKRTTRTNVTIVIAEIVLVALISLSLGWFLTRNLNQLILGTEAVARGDYSVRIAKSSDDEIGDLASHFNAMTTELEQQLAALGRSNKRFRDMADNTSDWLWEADLEGRYTFVSRQVEALLGYSVNHILGTMAFDLMHPDDAKRLRRQFENAYAQQKPFFGFEYRARRKDGSESVLEANGTPVVSELGDVTGYRGVTRDVTRRKEDESRLVYLAEHDALTGLLARQRFIELIDTEIRHATQTANNFAILFIDLDGFKLINDTYGHVVGDAILRNVAEIIRRQIREGDSLARMGGDEFGILLRGTGREVCEDLALQIITAIDSTPLGVGHADVHLFAGAGACLFPEGGTSSEELLAHADSAMAHAKSLGHNRCYVYQPSDRFLDNMRHQVGWQTRIHQALEQDMLLVEYQPIMALRPGQDAPKFEALLRMVDDSGTIFPASHFIETAERTGQVEDLDRWMLNAVLEALARPEYSDYTIAINLSGRSLGTPGFCDYFQDRVFESGIHPDKLFFEITESAAVAEMARAESFIARMRKLGFQFALDDFGVGFSSFSYLKHLPVDQIKIDGSFIRHIDRSREDQIFVMAIVQVAHELGLKTVAEFVETREVLDMLTDIGVDYVQGHFIGKPASSPVVPVIETRRQSTYKKGSRTVA